MSCLSAVDSRVIKLSAAALQVHQFPQRRVARCLALLAALPIATSAFATTFVWDGNFGFGSSRWSRDNNWSPLTGAPTTAVNGLINNDIVFAGGLKLAPQVDNNYYVRSLTFASGAGSFSLTPRATQSLFLGSGGIVNNSTNTQNLLTSLVLSNSQTWNAASGGLVMRGTVNLGANALSIAGSSAVALSNSIVGTGSITKLGSGNLILGGTTANTFSGGFNLQSGLVTVAKNNALGTGPLTISGGVLNLGSFNLGVGSISLLGGSINSVGGGISSSSTYQLQSGAINTSLGGTAGLLKSGAGTVSLTGANTYSGNTLISAGQLLVNNTTGSGTGLGNVSIGGGGLLSGTGSIFGAVTNGAGGSISAGNEIGVLNTGSLVWFGGATNRWDIQNAASTAGVGWDLLNINGSLTLNASSGAKAIIDMVSFTLGGSRGLAANFNPTQSYLWTMVQTTGGVFFAPGESELTVFDLLTGNFLNSTTGGTFGIVRSTDGRQLSLSYTPAPTAIPEPSMAGLLGIGLLGLIHLLRYNGNSGRFRS